MADLAGVPAEQFGAQVLLGVDGEPAVADRPGLGDQRFQVDHVHPRVPQGQLQQTGVELPPQHGQFGPRAVVHQLSQLAGQQRQGVEDQGARALADVCLGQPLDELQFRRHGLGGVRHPPGQREFVEDELGVQQDQREVGVLGVQRSGGVLEVTPPGVVVAEDGAQRDAVPGEFGGERAGERVEGAVARHGDGQRHRVGVQGVDRVGVDAGEQPAGAGQVAGGGGAVGEHGEQPGQGRELLGDPVRAVQGADAVQRLVPVGRHGPGRYGCGHGLFLTSLPSLH